LIQSLTRPDQSVTGYSYDALKRLTQIANKKSNQEIISQYNYSFNHPDFQLDQRSDELISGVSIVKPLQNETLSYDNNTLNQLTQISALGSPPSALSLVYDANGNMTRGYTPEGYEFTAAYDAENRLKSLEYTDNQGKIHTTLNTYRADSFLVKVEKFENHVKMMEVNFVGEGFLPIQERTTVAGQPSSVKSYIWGQNMGGGIGGLLALKQNGQDYSYLYDGKGNVTAVIDANQNTVAAYTYDEFGKVVSKTGILDQPFQFSTKYYDQQTGLNYYGYRFYSAALGRWINRDPLGEAGGINLYGFVGNNPTNYIDPYGEMGAAAAAIPLAGKIGAGGVGLGAFGTAAVWTGGALAAGAIGYGVTSWAIHDTWLGNGGIGNAVYDYLHKGGKEKGENWATDLAKAIAGQTGRNICDILREMYDKECDSKRKLAIKAAQKFLGCRRSSGG
jgi:RHS repeat-associated protein